MNDENPEVRFPKRKPPFSDLSFSTLGWLNRAASAVGADRFFECLERAQFYLDRTAATAATPAERAVVAGLTLSLSALIDTDRVARKLLQASCSGMDAAEATEFVEMCEAAENPAL